MGKLKKALKVHEFTITVDMLTMLSLMTSAICSHSCLMAYY